MAKTATHQKTPRKAAIASLIGTALEYYDFAVYGTASALVLNVLFFPPELPKGIGVLLSMVTLAIGYAVRPLGALILGPLADRYGRRRIFLASVLLFGVTSLICGLARSLAVRPVTLRARLSHGGALFRCCQASLGGGYGALLT